MGSFIVCGPKAEHQCLMLHYSPDKEPQLVFQLILNSWCAPCLLFHCCRMRELSSFVMLTFKKSSFSNSAGQSIECQPLTFPPFISCQFVGWCCCQQLALCGNVSALNSDTENNIKQGVFSCRGLEITILDAGCSVELHEWGNRVALMSMTLRTFWSGITVV